MGGGSIYQHSQKVGVGEMQAVSSCPPKITGFGREKPQNEGFTGHPIRLNSYLSLHNQYFGRNNFINIRLSIWSIQSKARACGLYPCTSFIYI